jgi:hypothetical protein
VSEDKNQTLKNGEIVSIIPYRNSSARKRRKKKEMLAMYGMFELSNL